jgi:hypothetical protein
MPRDPAGRRSDAQLSSTILGISKAAGSVGHFYPFLYNLVSGK